MFLTIGQTQRYPKYNNPCGSCMQVAVKFSVANEVIRRVDFNFKGWLFGKKLEIGILNLGFFLKVW